MQFNCPVTDSGGNPISTWLWDFGDGQIGVAQNPSHAYRVQGLFTPVLTAINRAGLPIVVSGPSLIVSSGLLVNPGFEQPPDPITGAINGWTKGNTNGFYAGAFVDDIKPHGGTNDVVFDGFQIISQTIPTTPGAGYLISFWYRSNARPAGPPYVQAYWDGGMVYAQTNPPTFVWTNAQVFATASTSNTVLQLQINSYNDNIWVDDVSVTPVPFVYFTATPTNGAAPLVVQIKCPAVDIEGHAITNWHWDFGDGSSSSAQSPSHTFYVAGGVSPNLLAKDNSGKDVIGVGPMIKATLNSGIVSNGGFETGDFRGWMQTGDTNNGYVGGIGDSFAHSGTFYAEFFELNSGLYQALPTTPGATYVLSFWLNSSGLFPNEFFASWNGTALLDQLNLPNVGWTNYQFTVLATGTSTALQFGFNNTSSYGDYGYSDLDDVSVLPLAGQPSQPLITGVALSGNNLVLSGANGQSGGTYRLLASTNTALPFNQWLPIATNVLGASGDFSLTATNAVNHAIPTRFFILQLQ